MFRQRFKLAAIKTAKSLRRAPSCLKIELVFIEARFINCAGLMRKKIRHLSAIFIDLRNVGLLFSILAENFVRMG